MLWLDDLESLEAIAENEEVAGSSSGWRTHRLH